MTRKRPRSCAARKRKGGRPGCADLDEEGKPLVDRLACPVQNMPKQLQGKDWTKYLGFLHTDHAVREEFFADRAQPGHRAWAAYPRLHLPVRPDAGRFRQFHPRQALLEGRCLCRHWAAGDLDPPRDGKAAGAGANAGADDPGRPAAQCLPELEAERGLSRSGPTGVRRHSASVEAVMRQKAENEALDRYARR